MGFNFSYLQIIQKTCEKEETRRVCQTNCSKNRVILWLQCRRRKQRPSRPPPPPATLPFSGLSGISELLLRSGDFNFRARGKKDEDVVQVSLSFSFNGGVTDKIDNLERKVMSVIAAECFSFIAIQYRSSWTPSFAQFCEIRRWNVNHVRGITVERKYSWPYL